MGGKNGLAKGKGRDQSSEMPAATPFSGKNQYTRLCFTVNLPDGKGFGDYDLKKLRVALNPSFFIVGKERGGETNRRHFQGYLEFPKKRTGFVIDKIFRMTFPLPISCHYEAAIGSAQQNCNYCSKEDPSVFIFGEPRPGQGARTDLENIFDKIKKGATPLEIANDHPQQWVVHNRSFDKYRAMVDPKRNKPSQLIFLWGPTGTGKTMHAQELEPTTVTWVSRQYLNGFHGGEKVILFDDFDYNCMDWQTFLTMTDRYALTINVKLGAVNFAPETIIFTSNSDPKSWWPRAPEETKKAIHRRMEEFGEIRHLGSLVPKEENILTKFLKRTVVAPAAAAAEDTDSLRILPAHTRVPTPETVILDSDDEDYIYRESQHSDHSNSIRLARQRSYAETHWSQGSQDLV